MELAQLYVPGRNTSLLDLTTNVIGSAVGVALAVVFEGIAGPWHARRPNVSADRGALMLLFCWVAWLVFPFFPVLGTFVVFGKIRALAAPPLVMPMAILSSAAVWYAAGELLQAAAIPRSLEILALSILIVPAQLFIVGRQPTLSDLFGAIAGFLLFASRPRARTVTKAEAWAFLAVVVLRGFSPFRFVAAAAEFTWVPFGALLLTEWQSGLQVLLGKVFYYTCPIWLLRATGMRLWLATAIVAAFLAVIEAAQTHLPGRTPEIMDPLLAIIMGFVLFILSRETGRRFRSAE